MQNKIAVMANESWNIFNFRRGLITSLIKNGIQVDVIAPKDSYSKTLEQIGCNFIPLKISPQSVNLFIDLLLCAKLFFILKKIKPSLLITYTIKANIYGSLVAKLLKIPTLAVTTGLGYTFINNNLVTKIARKLYKIAYRYPVEVWFLNCDDYNLFINYKLIDNKRAQIVNGSGINTDEFINSNIKNSNKKENIKFLLIARMIKDKGILEFINAAKDIKKTYPKVEFQLLGQGDVKNPAAIKQDEIDGWVKAEIVSFIGLVKNVKPYIEEADCIVLPSYREGVPRALMEAASMSKPIIASDAPGCKEVVIDGVTGFIAASKDYKDLASQFLKMIMLTDNERIRMGHEGRQLMIEKFDEKLIVKKYFDFFNRIHLFTKLDDVKLKIIISANSSWNLINFRMGVIETLIKKGHEVIAVAPEDEYSKFLKDYGCKFIPININSKGINPFYDILLMIQYLIIFLINRPDLYLGYTIKPNIYGSLAGRILNISIINNIAGLGIVFSQNNWLKKLVENLYRISLAGSYKVIFQNNEDMRYFIKNKICNPNKVTRVPGSGVNLTKYQFQPSLGHNKKFRFILIARLIWDKGVSEYIEAAKILRNEGFNCEFCILGFLEIQNPSSISLDTMEQWKADGVINYLGGSNNVAAEIVLSDCVVLPSYYPEGVPRSLLEAGAIGRPIITTNTPGCKETIEDGVTGFFCNTRDPIDLAVKMKKMLSLTKYELNQMGYLARKKIEVQFDEVIVVNKYLELTNCISSLISKKV